MNSQGTPLPSEWVQRSTEKEAMKIREVALLTTISTALQAGIVTFFFYYCALHFSEEVEYIWARPWTRGKVVYVLSRYSGAIFLMFVTLQILMAIGLFPIRWNEAGKPLVGDKKLEILEVGVCLGGYLYVLSGTIAILLSEAILAMRIYAIYGRRKRIIVLSVILMVISAAGTQALGVAYVEKPAKSCIGKPAKSCIGKPCLYDDISIPYRVTVTCSLASNTISVFGWIPASLVEIVFLALVLWKIRGMQKIRGEYSLVTDEKMPHHVDIIGVLARDSKRYFIQTFLICFVGACINVTLILINFKVSSVFALFVPAALSNAFVTFAVATLSIIAPNLFISLRMEYYGLDGSLADRSQLSWDVAVPPGNQSTESQDQRSSQRGEYSVIEDQES